jgi:hypothetical protein
MSQLYHIRIFLEDSRLDSLLPNEYIITLRPDGYVVESSKHKRGLGPYYRIKDSDSLIRNKDRCTICLEGYKSGTYKRKISCNHVFHKKCIDKWFKKSGNVNCPICRKNHDYLLHESLEPKQLIEPNVVHT